jgi:hypothetical protein
MMMNHSELLNELFCRELLNELFRSIDEYTFSRVVKVTPKFEKFISEVEDIRTRLAGAVDTRDDGK